MSNIRIQNFPKWALSVLGISGSLSGGYAPQLSQTVSPVVVLGTNDQDGAQMICNLNLPAGGAATQAEAQLFNPSSSNKQLILRRLRVCVGAGGQYQVTDFKTALATDNSGQIKTRRMPATAAETVAQMRSAFPAAIDGTAFLVKIVQPATTFVDAQLNGLPILPGCGLLVANLTANEQLITIWEWDEIPL